MKRKLLFGIVTLFAVFNLFIFNTAEAAIKNKADLTKKISTLETIKKKDFGTMYNKSALIGKRGEEFQQLANEYKSSIEAYQNQLKTILSDVEVLEKKIQDESKDPDETAASDIEETKAKINTLYQSADTILYNADSRTTSFTRGLSTLMPTVTYSRFQESFNAFYNSLNLTK